MDLGEGLTEMKLLFCSEFFYPSVGGAQEVMRQIAVRMVALGHDVTVATSKLATRQSDEYCGIKIKSFAIAGNLVNGMEGEIDQYQRFLIENDFDLVFIYAAQQWTFDALWDVLPKLRIGKVFVPCGYSGLMNPNYHEYFYRLPSILKHFDALVYHARNYRDYDFGKQFGLETKSILIPNGADDQEFATHPDPDFRSRMLIWDNALVLLTVGSLTGSKGHLELVRAFEQLKLKGQCAVLILNGNRIPIQYNGETLMGSISKIVRYMRSNSLSRVLQTSIRALLSTIGFRFGYFANLEKNIKRINKMKDRKVMQCDLERSDLVQAYFTSDLFVFASNIEYSPLVLYEACAGGVPFLSVSSGNASEIAKWTGGGKVIDVNPDKNGYTKVSPSVLSTEIERLLDDRELRMNMALSGRNAWKTRYNWDVLSKEYLELFERVCHTYRKG